MRYMLRVRFVLRKEVDFNLIRFFRERSRIVELCKVFFEKVCLSFNDKIKYIVKDRHVDAHTHPWGIN